MYTESSFYILVILCYQATHRIDLDDLHLRQGAGRCGTRCDAPERGQPNRSNITTEIKAITSKPPRASGQLHCHWPFSLYMMLFGLRDYVLWSEPASRSIKQYNL